MENGVGAADCKAVSLDQTLFNIIKYAAVDAYRLFAGLALHMEMVLVTAREAVKRAFSYIIYRTRDCALRNESLKGAVDRWLRDRVPLARQSRYYLVRGMKLRVVLEIFQHQLALTRPVSRCFIIHGCSSSEFEFETWYQILML